ncbi:MAG: hypothetical protein ASARMPRED_005017 [Alectoria sarmentosa]|nr:MAG: hypothetical protein ASARMPRED_005017 [Alectoria sarmentosa]
MPPTTLREETQDLAAKLILFVCHSLTTTQRSGADLRFRFQDSALIIALSNYWQDNESPGPYCGRKIQITNQGGGSDNNGQGNVVVATVQDTCPSCDENHLDLSEGAFKALTGGNLDPPGEFNICWHFCNTDGQC